MLRPPLHLPPAAVSGLLGLALALTLAPLPTGILTPVVLAALLLYAASTATPRGVAGRLFWAALVMNAVHLSWLMAFVGQLLGSPALGVLAFLLYAVEGSFYALMGYLVARLIGGVPVLPGPQRLSGVLGRVWGLAGGWVVLEALRFLGPFAFPWPTLGYSLIDTPMIQIADLGGVLLCSVLVALSAAALVQFWHGRTKALWGVVVCWLLALGYGLTRVPGQGIPGQALLQRTAVDAFAKASHLQSPEQQFQTYNRLTQDNRQPGEVPVWTETAIQDPALLKLTPMNGIYGVADLLGSRSNKAVAWTGSAVVGSNDKARPVPFGEYFPLRTQLDPAWRMIEGVTHMNLETTPAAVQLSPLTLGGVVYGTYICYDSVFPWVARQLTRQGAQVLVNISNDSWYTGWGVQQHFLMGRVRAIENRRWVLRSVNKGVAGSIDDLGRPRLTLSRGEGVIHARFPLLTTKTLFGEVGDWPALLLALGLLAYGWQLTRPKLTRP
ncbi:apolipoprotein N-acyltransferase [Deinococcus sp.]|uniref:apolipoprotein N-acyltransferase n=1 Tax=Deinococcus sp. TaxID=47478 RepID=UPI0025C59151|nr:apolipoprotein N-acyltransferase [Deinococcus sp.]